MIIKQNKNKLLLVTFIVSLILAVLCICCCSATLFIGGTISLDSVKEAFSQTICSKEDLSKVYKEKTSDLFKTYFTEAEYSDFVNQTQNDCEKMSKANVIDVFNNGWGVSVDDGLRQSATFDGKFGTNNVVIHFDNDGDKYILNQIEEK